MEKTGLVSAAGSGVAATEPGVSVSRGGGGGGTGNSPAPPDLDTTMRTLLSLPGVEGFLLINSAGVPVKWSPGAPFARATGVSGGGIGVGGGGGGAVALASAPPTIPASVVHYAAALDDLSVRARAAWRRLFGEEASAGAGRPGGAAAPAASTSAGGLGGSLSLLRLRTTEGELIIAPHNECTLAISQTAAPDTGALPASWP